MGSLLLRVVIHAVISGKQSSQLDYEYTFEVNVHFLDVHFLDVLLLDVLLLDVTIRCR